jgi:hypothetical protein
MREDCVEKFPQITVLKLEADGAIRFEVKPVRVERVEKLLKMIEDCVEKLFQITVDKELISEPERLLLFTSV